MNAFFSNLMAAWLLFLAVSGWCCHPLGHIFRCSELSATQSDASTCCDDCAPERQQSPSPCKQQDKCQGVCTYLPEKTTEIDFGSASSPYDVVFLASTDADKYLLVPFRLELACKLVDSSPPLRPHLLHRILLI